MSDPVRLVQDAYAAFGRGDIEGVLSFMAPDVEWDVVGREADYPTFGPRSGLAGARAFFEANFAEQEVHNFQPQRFHDAGDVVVVEGRIDLTVKRTGKPLVVEFLHLFEIRDGKVVRFREFTDTAAAAAAFAA